MTEKKVVKEKEVVVKIVSQETVNVDGEMKIKYTLSDGSEKMVGL